MKKWKFWSILLLAMSSFAQESGAPKQPATLRNLLLTELRETHNQKNWFVSEKDAVRGLTPEQAAWSDGKNHSVGQLVQHMTFWNSFNLAYFKGEHPPAPGNNDNTFKNDAQQWDATLKQFDNVMDEWEHIVERADDATLTKIAPLIARISQHNAYHIGEIIAVRKAHGMWDPALGVN
jgi:hypothetical protein